MLNMLRTFFIVVVLILAAAPVFAGEPAGPTAAPAVVPSAAAASEPGCAPALDLAAVVSAQAEICPATAPETAAPESMGRPPLLRTCACSCGYPCSTDADCGPGGICTAGITCC